MIQLYKEAHNGDFNRRHCAVKKKHPCGSFDWEVLRSGADFRLKCCGCEHQGDDGAEAGGEEHSETGEMGKKLRLPDR